MRRLVAFLLVFGGVVSVGFAGERALHYFVNDSISVEINDYEYVYDQIRYRYGTSTWIDNLYHLSVAFWDGSTIWEYNTTTRPNGFSGLVEVEDWTFSGPDPHSSAHVILGDDATTPSFTIEMTIRMEGDGFKGIRTDFVIRAVSGSLSGAKLYLYGDPKVSGDDWTNRGAYSASNDLFYIYDVDNTPNLAWGVSRSCAGTCADLQMHYYGHQYSGSYGTEPMRAYMLTGDNYPDLVDGSSGNQVAGWNWDLGSFSGSVELTVYMGVGTSLADLVEEIRAPIFRDGFEDGTRWW